MWKKRTRRRYAEACSRCFVLILALVGTVASAQVPDSSSRSVVYVAPVAVKDPQLAGILSFVIPGAGQVYAARPVKGVTLWAIAATGATILIRGWSKPGPYSDGGGLSNEKLTGGALYLGALLVSVFTAGDDARDYNRARATAERTSR